MAICQWNINVNYLGVKQSEKRGRAKYMEEYLVVEESEQT